jgi:NADH:ubiquinone oxidoreductase subunit F (NADH-binding)
MLTFSSVVFCHVQEQIKDEVVEAVPSIFICVEPKVINQEVKMEHLDSTYNSIIKKEHFTKCESCRQCKRCNPGSI